MPTKETLTKRPHMCSYIPHLVSNIVLNQGDYEWDAWTSVLLGLWCVPAACITIPKLIETGSRWFHWHCV